MEKKRLFKILAKADRTVVHHMAKKIKKKHEITIIKRPNKTLTMIKMREPVKTSLFYIGEIIVCECVVEIGEVRGMAVTMGDDLDKVLDMAIIDAACNKQIFKDESLLLELEKSQKEFEEKENAMHLNTMVNFNTMNSEA